MTWIDLLARWFGLAACLFAPLALGYDWGTHDAVDIAKARSPASIEFMLSFDDGPMPGATERVLEALADLRAVDGEPVRAAFFLVGDAPAGFWSERGYYAPYEIWSKGSLAKYPQLARRIQRAGHLIGNHTAHHAWFYWPWLRTTAAIRAEMEAWETLHEAHLGPLKSRLFRPPYLIVSRAVREAARATGYQLVLGEPVNDVALDASVEEVQRRARGILTTWDKPYPCLLIFHDTQPVTYQHIGAIVRSLQAQGFRLVHFTADEPENRLAFADDVDG